MAMASLTKKYNYAIADPYALTGGLNPLESMSVSQPGGAVRMGSSMPRLGAASAGSRLTGDPYNQAAAFQNYRGSILGAVTTGGQEPAEVESPYLGTYFADFGQQRGVEANREAARFDVAGRALKMLEPGSYRYAGMPAEHWAAETRRQAGDLTTQWQQARANLDAKLRRREIDNPGYDAAVAELDRTMRSKIAQARAGVRTEARNYGMEAAMKRAAGYTNVMGQIPSDRMRMEMPQGTRMYQSRESQLGAGAGLGGGRSGGGRVGRGQPNDWAASIIGGGDGGTKVTGPVGEDESYFGRISEGLYGDVGAKAGGYNDILGPVGGTLEEGDELATASAPAGYPTGWSRGGLGTIGNINTGYEATEANPPYYNEYGELVGNPPLYDEYDPYLEYPNY